MCPSCAFTDIYILCTYYVLTYITIIYDLSLRVKYHARHLTYLYYTYFIYRYAWNALAHYNNIIIILIYNIYNIMYNEVA